MPVTHATEQTQVIETFEQLSQLSAQQEHRAVAVVDSSSGALLWWVNYDACGWI